MSTAALFIASLIGSTHCAAMCGGLVLTYSNQFLGQKGTHFLYHLGRLVTYSLLGAFMGFLGRGINDFGLWLGIQALATLLMALFLVLSGFSQIFGKPFPSLFDQMLGPWKSTWVRALQGKTKGHVFIVGLLTGFLPCGWLYSFLIVAAGTGSPMSGAFSMLVFWTGTVPILLGISRFGQWMLRRLGASTQKVSGLILVAGGFLSLAIHLQWVNLGFHDQHGENPSKGPKMNHSHHSKPR